MILSGSEKAVILGFYKQAFKKLFIDMTAVETNYHRALFRTNIFLFVRGVYP